MSVTKVNANPKNINPTAIMENIFSLRSSGSVDSKLYFLDIVAKNMLVMHAVAVSQKNIDISCAPYELKTGVCNVFV